MIESKKRHMAGRLVAAIVATGCLFGGFAVKAETNLPKVIILGKPYYCYEASKGDSLFGIAQKFGWDPQVIGDLNSNISTPIEKGTQIYYPAYGETEAVAGGEKGQGDVVRKSRRVTHEVASGETIYSISRMYGIPMERLYAMNPSARDGIRTGSLLVIAEEEVLPAAAPAKTGSPAPAAAEETEPPVAVDGGDETHEYVYHAVEADEDLLQISREYNTTVEDIYRDNPGLTPDKVEAGDVVRITPGTRDENVRYEKGTEEKLVGIRTYKVQKGDTWAGVARKLGVDQQLLRESNPGKWKLKKGDELAVPVTQTVEVENAWHEDDVREQTSEGRRELYEEVHDLGVTTPGADILQEVKIAVVLDDTSSNKDMEFSRGALLAADRLKNSGFKTTLKFLDGALPMSRIITELETFQPNLVVTTADKTLPDYLTDFARRTSTQLVNSFDVKSEAYIDNPSIIQFLTPSSYFNDGVRDYVTEHFGDYDIVFAGSRNASDALGEGIAVAVDPDRLSETDVAAITEYPVEENGRYLIYGTPTSKEDVAQLLENVAVLKSSHPLAEISVLGRPNWIVYAESMKDKMGECNVMIPSRFYFNASEPENRMFISDYQELFGQTPVKSYPVYAVAGYDILTYFLPNISATGGDFNAGFRKARTLQSEISLRRISNWGGIYNPDCYIIEFSGISTPEKILLK